MNTALRTLAALFALVVASVSEPLPRRRYGDITVAIAQEACEDGLTVACCNAKGAGQDEGGALSGLLDNGLFGECAKLDIALLTGAQDLLDDNCNGQVACCSENNAGVLVDLSCNPIKV